jgi:hypothetical protein
MGINSYFCKRSRRDKSFNDNPTMDIMQLAISDMRADFHSGPGSDQHIHIHGHQRHCYQQLPGTDCRRLNEMFVEARIYPV